MITPFNRVQLATFFDLAQREALCAALARAGIAYAVKTVNRASPSALNFGSRERSGTLLHQMDQNWYDIVYVKKADQEAAQQFL